MALNVMQIAARFQQGWDQFRNDTQDLARDVAVFLKSLPDETMLLLGIMFILGLFYLIVRQPSEVKHKGDMGRQFVYALAIVLIFGFGIDWVMDYNGLSKVTRI